MLSQETKEYLLKLAQDDCDRWQDDLTRAKALSYATAELREAIIDWHESRHGRAKAVVVELEGDQC